MLSGGCKGVAGLCGGEEGEGTIEQSFEKDGKGWNRRAFLRLADGWVG